MSEIRNCPHCDKPLTYKTAFSGDGYPQMCQCVWETNTGEDAINQWNKRPREDALLARIRSLEHDHKVMREALKEIVENVGVYTIDNVKDGTVLSEGEGW